MIQGSTTSSATAVADEILGNVTAEFVARSASTHGSGARVLPSVSLGAPQIAQVHPITAMDFFLPSMMAYIILQSGINFVAITLVDLRSRQVLRRFRATPLRPSVILGSQVIGGAVTVLLQVALLVAVGVGLYHAVNYGSWFIVLIPVLLGTAAFVGIGFLITSAAKTSEAARGIATFIAFPMMFLSGLFFPVSDLPGALQTAVHILPLTWLSDALQQVMDNGAGLPAIAVDCGVLAAWAVVTISIAIWRFRWE